MNRIKDLRKEKDLTLKELGAKVYMPDNTLSQYENGKREPKLETWQKLANFFKVTVPYLQGVSDIRDPKEQETMNKLISIRNKSAHTMKFDDNDKKVISDLLSNPNYRNLFEIMTIYSYMNSFKYPSLNKQDINLLENNCYVNKFNVNKLINNLEYFRDGDFNSTQDKKAMALIKELNRLLDDKKTNNSDSSPKKEKNSK